MKISNYMNNTNSIMEKNTDKVQKGNSQTNEKHTVGQSVKLSISNEGLEYYRNRIQQSGHGVNLLDEKVPFPKGFDAIWMSQFQTTPNKQATRIIFFMINVF